MKNSLVVQESKSFQQLLHETFDVLMPKLKLRVTQDPGQIVVHVLEHHVDRAFGYHEFLQPNHMAMAQRLQQLDFSHGSDRELDEHMLC